MVKRVLVGIVAVTATMIGQISGALASCPGDCSGDGEVTIDELILGVGIALGSAALNQCAAFDRDGSGEVTVDELIGGVNAGLGGCPAAAPTATATATATPGTGLTPTPAIVPPGISAAMLGTWSGRAKNDPLGIDKAVRIKIEVVSNVVRITDLGGNLFVGGATLNVTIAAPTAVFANRGTPPGRTEALTLATLPVGNGLAGEYAVVTFSPFPNATGLALIFDVKE